MTKFIHAAMILHQQGKRHVEVGDLKNAQYCLEQALTLSPNDPALALTLAHIYKKSGFLDKAEAILLNLLENDATCPFLYNNLGGIYYSQRRFKAAQVAYRHAISLHADYLEAYYNLALALSKNHEHEAAIDVYRQLIGAAPEHAAARFQLGCLLMQQVDYVSAAEQFLQIVAAEIQHIETWSNLANCYLKLGRWEQAKHYYLQVLTVAEDEQALFNLGVIYKQLGETRTAIGYYQRLCRLYQEQQSSVPQTVSMAQGGLAEMLPIEQQMLALSKVQPSDVHYNLALAYLEIDDRQSALFHLQTVLQIKPDQHAVRFMLQVMTAPDSVHAASPPFVQALFDGYANHYDAHMQAVLNYQVPKLMHQIIGELRAVHAYATILDLGCGTGLCGDWLRPMTQMLVGVDLSPAMLAKAAAKNHYDQLVHDDLLLFLRSEQHAARTYDGVIAADVLVYFGELTSLFELVSGVLKPGGWFIFSTEITTEKDYQLATSARFAHHERYIKSLATQNGLGLLRQTAAKLRKQEQTYVPGYVYALQKLQ